MRFGRKSGSTSSEVTAEPDPPVVDDRVGPFDASEVDVDERDCVDLGSLLVTPLDGMELQLQVDEESGEVMAVLLVGESGALELRAFAASRGSGAWDELRPRISAEMARLGGTSDEKQGSFGTELLCMVPVHSPEGQHQTQASRIVAHEGPAWLLRATVMGPAAIDPALGAPFEETIRQVVVRRGREAKPPGAPLPLTLPHEVTRVGETPTDENPVT